MTMKRLLFFVPAMLAAGGANAVLAGETINDVGAISCVVDKWEEKEVSKGHKTVAYASRCVLVPDDAAQSKSTEVCSGDFEYLPDGSWKGSGSCTDTYKGGGTTSLTWEEGSHLKEFTYTKTGGTGKYAGVTGGGTYTYENLTDTLTGGRYKGTMVLP